MITHLPAGWTNRFGARLADFYRDLHMHPELSFQEHRTAQKVREAIAELGLEVTAEVGGTGVVAVIRNGPGPIIMLRADFDALPVQERTGLPYQSVARAVDADGRQVPVMHACGHDMHATALVGALHVLSELRAQWTGTAVAVFQPAEELGQGAIAMIADGLFERFPVPAVVLGQHVTPLPAGTIAYKTGTLLAAADSIKVRLLGRGGHGSRPEDTVDPVVMAANVVQRLQTIVSRERSPFEPAVVTVGYVHAGAKDNIIPDEAELGINVRTFDETVRTATLASITRIINAEALASGAERPPEIVPIHSFPATTVDATVMRQLADRFRKHFGADRVSEFDEPRAASEDVGIYGATLGIPTAFWLWGGSDSEVLKQQEQTATPVPGNHSPLFAPVLEPTLTTGVETLTTAALELLTTAATP